MLALIQQLQQSPSGMSAQALSAAIDRPLSLVTAMLEHLERSGRIERIAMESHCAISKGCRQCPERKGCTTYLYRLRT